MNRSPAFQFYPDKWQSHTFHLSDAAYRLYHEILCWMWQHAPDQCSIPSNTSTIAILMRRQCDGIAEAMREITNPDMPLLRTVGDKLVSEGLKKETQKQSKRRLACSDSAKQRWNKKLDVCERNANAMPTVCSPSPSPSPIAERESHFPESNGAPTLKEVLAKADIIGLAAWKAEDWFNEMAGGGWLDHQHRPIKDWTAVLTRVRTKWESDGRPSGPPQSKQQSQPKPVDFKKQVEQDRQLDEIERRYKAFTK